MLTAANQQIRQSFRQNIAMDSALAGPAIQHATEVASFLRANVVQGERKEDNMFSQWDERRWGATAN